MKVTLEGNQVYWANFGGNEVMTLDVRCGPTSTVLSEGTFTAVQWGDKNQGNGFMLPIFSTSVASCPAEVFEVSTTNTGVNQPGSGFVVNGAETSVGSGSYVVKPQDDSLDLKYEFYVKVTARGGSVLFSSKYTLIIGCTSDMTLAQHPSIQLTKSPYVNQPVVNVFQIMNTPVITPSYCSHFLLNHYVINEAINGTASAGAVTLSSTCLGIQPCSKFDVISTSNLIIYTF